MSDIYNPDEERIQFEQSLADNKRNHLAKASQEKKKYLDPETAKALQAIDADTYKIVDGDSYRFDTGDAATTIDAFESNEDIYLRNPGRFRQHQKEFAHAYGVQDWKKVTAKQLTDLGKVQKNAVRQNVTEGLQSGHLKFRENGYDKYGRTLLVPEDTRQEGNLIEMLNQRGQNAAYYSKYNSERRLRDLASGETAQHLQATTPRTWGETARDAPGKILTGALDYGIQLGQTLDVMKGRGPETAGLWKQNREMLEKVENTIISDAAINRDKFSQKRNAIHEELYDQRVADRMSEGQGKTEATVRTIAESAGDTVRNLYQSPGRVFDEVLKSANYMVQAGLIGKATTKVIVSQVEKNVAKGVIKRGLGKETTKRITAKRVEQYLKSDAGKRASRAITTATTVTGIGLMEAVTNSAEVYNNIIGMTPEQASESETYNSMIAAGRSHEDAVAEMAEEAFNKTLIITFGVAAGASLITGAGGFESRMFTNMFAPGKKKITNEAIKQSLTGRATSVVGKNVVKPGLQETAEEAIQSGGGEYISQAASEKATGKEPGQGVGTALGEGAAIGLASGSGIGATSGAVKGIVGGGGKKVVRAVQNRKRSKAYPRVKGAAPIMGNTASSTNASQPAAASNSPGGSATQSAQAAAKVKNDPKLNTPAAALVRLQKSLRPIFDALNKNKVPDLTGYRQVEANYEELVALDPEKANDTVLKGQMDTVRSAFEVTLNAHAEQIVSDLKADPKRKLTKSEIGILQEASTRDMPAVSKVSLETISNGQIKDGLAHNREVNTLMNKISERSASFMEAAKKAFSIAKTGRKTAEQVENEKLGNTVSIIKGKAKMGLGMYRATMQEAITNNSVGTFKALLKGLDHFIDTQVAKQARLRKAIDHFNETGEMSLDQKTWYEPADENGNGGSEALLKQLEAESLDMFELRNLMAKQYQEFNPDTKDVEVNRVATESSADRFAASQAKAGINQTTPEDGEAGATEAVEQEAKPDATQPKGATVTTSEGNTEDNDTKTFLEAKTQAKNKIKYLKKQLDKVDFEGRDPNNQAQQIKVDEAHVRIFEAQIALDRMEQIRSSMNKGLSLAEAIAKYEIFKQRVLDNKTAKHPLNQLALLLKAMKSPTVSTSTESKSVKAINAITAAIAHLPAPIRGVINVIYEVAPKLTGKEYLSLKSTLAKAGITSPDAKRWAFKNKDLPELKNVKSQQDLEDVVWARYAYKTDRANYPKILDGEMVEAYDNWVMALEADHLMDPYFMEMMMDVPLKQVSDPKRDRPGLPPVNINALNEVHTHYVANPAFQGLPKYYGKIVARYTTESADQEESASGKGYWVHIPKTDPMLHDGQDNPEHQINYKRLQQLSPGTWCTHSWAAPEHVTTRDNMLLIVDGSAVVGIESYDGVIGDVTSIANNGTASIEHLDDTIAYADKHDLNYTESWPMNAAIEARDSGKTDVDMFREQDFEQNEEGMWFAEEFLDERTPEEVAEDERIQELGWFNRHIDTLENNIASLKRMTNSTSYLALRAGTPLTNLDITEVLIGDQINARGEGVDSLILQFLSPVEIDQIVKDAEVTLANSTVDNYRQENPLTEIIQSAVLNKFNNTFNTTLGPENIRWGGQGFNLPGHALFELMKLDSDANFQQLAKEWLSPILYSSYENGIIILNDYGMYAAEAAVTNGVAGSSNAINRETLNAHFRTTLDTIFPITNLLNDEQTSAIVHFEPHNIIPTFFDNEAGARFSDHFHFQIHVLRQAALQNNNVQAQNHRRLFAENVEEVEVPFSKTITGDIEGWSDGERAVLNAAHLDPKDAAIVALHETAHLGMIRVAEELGGFKELYKVLQGAETQLMKKLPELLQRTGHASLEEFVADYGFDINTDEGKAKLLGELAARWAETFDTKSPSKWWTDLIAAISDWVKTFVGKELNKKEVDAMVAGFIKYGTLPKVVAAPTETIATNAVPAQAQVEQGETLPDTQPVPLWVPATVNDLHGKPVPVITDIPPEVSASNNWRGGRLAADRSALYFDAAMVMADFVNKPWLTPKTEGVDPLSVEFKTAEEWAKFVFQHERQHALKLQGENESRAHYENRINQAALKALKLIEVDTTTQQQQTIDRFAASQLQATPSTETLPDEERQIVEEKVAQGTSTEAALEQRKNEILEENPGLAPTPKITLNKAQQKVVDAARKLWKGEKITSITKDFIDNAISFLDERIIPKLAGFSNTVEGIKAKFLRNKLPTTIGQVMQPRLKEVGTLLAGIPNVMELLKDTNLREGMFADLGLTEVQKAAMYTFMDFNEEFKAHLEAIQLGWENENTNSVFFELGSYADQKLIQSPLQFLMDGSGNLDPNHVAAMALETMNWLATGGPQTVENDVDAIASIMGIDPELVNAEMERMLQGKGTVMNLLSMQVGLAASKHMNLEQIKGTSDPLFEGRMVASIGGMALAVLHNMGRIETSSIERSWFEKMAKDVPGKHRLAQAGAKVNFVRIKTNDVFSPNTGEEYTVHTRQNKKTLEGFREGKDIFSKLFGAVPMVRFPTFEAPENPPRIVSRAMSIIPKILRDRIAKMMDHSWVPENGVIDFFNIMDIESFVINGHGYKSEAELLNDTHITELESAQGKNRGIQRDVEAARDWHAKYKNKKFYFAHKVIRSGRIYIESNVINPQASKIHRFMFTMSKWQRTLSTKPTVGQKGKHNSFLVAVGLGLGIDAGNLTYDKTLKETNALLKKKHIVDALNIIGSAIQDGRTDRLTGEEQAIINKATKAEGTHSLAALVAYAKFQNALANGDATFTTSLPMEVDGKTNGFAAGLVQTPAIDQIHEGVMLQMLRAVGLYTTADKFKNFPRFKAAGNKDNYESTAFDTHGNLQDMMNAPEPVAPQPTGNEKRDWALKYQYRNEIVQKKAAFVIASGLLPTMKELLIAAGRDWAKNPLMVVSYGAAMGSVVRAITEHAMRKFYTKLGEAQTAGEMAAIMNGAFQVIHTVEQANRTAGISRWDGRRTQYTAAGIEEMAARQGQTVKEWSSNFLLDKYERQWLELGVQVTYGSALVGALTTKLAPFQAIRDVMNHAIWYQNRIFVADFTRRMEQLAELKGSLVNQAERHGILRKMHREGLVPMIPTPLSEGEPGVPAHMTNQEVTNYDQEYLSDKLSKGDTYRGEGRAFFHQATIEQTIQLIDKAFNEDGQEKTANKQKSLKTRLRGVLPDVDVGVSGVVKAIHAMDGANNSEIFAMFAVLNMHDAVIGAFDETRKRTKFANKGFLNIHKKYSLVEEVLKATLNMDTLMHPTDSRLSKEEKQSIYDDFTDHLESFGQVDAPLPGEKLNTQFETEEFIRKFRNTTRRVNEARRKLFKMLTYINQFALEHGEYPVEDVDRTDSGEENALLSPLEMTTQELTEAFRDTFVKDNVRYRDKWINHFETVLREEGFDALNNELLSFLNDKQDATDVMYILQSVFDNADHSIGPILRKINNAVSKSLEGQTIETGNVGPNRTGLFIPGSPIVISNRLKNDGTPDSVVVRDVVHELMHAALQTGLEELEKSDPAAFKQLWQDIYTKAKQLRTTATRSGNKTNLRIAKDILSWIEHPKHTSKPKYANMVSEYMAYSLSAEKAFSDTGRYALRFGGAANLIQLWKTLGTIITNSRTGEAPLYSSARGINEDLFENAFENLVTSESIKEIFNQVDELGKVPESDTHNAMLDNFMETFLHEGIQTMEPIFQAIVTNPDGTLNEGAFRNGTVYIETAGNELTNNAAMSLKEVIAHELAHPILKAAINDVHSIRKEIDRLWRQAKANLDPIDLMPETVVGDYDTAFAMATERYDHIFNNRDGQQLHEFMAIALTNERFANALDTLSNKDTREGIFDNGMMSAIFNVFTRVMSWLADKSYQSGTGTINDGVKKMAEEILAVNYQNQQGIIKESKYAAAIEGANDFVTRTFVDKIVEPLQDYTDTKGKEYIDNPEVGKNIKANTIKLGRGVVSLRSKEFINVINEVYREFEGAKDGTVYQVLSEVLPYAKRNLPWIRLLRRSKVMIDMVRQQITEYTRTALLKKFDPKKYQSTAQRQALNNVVLRGDLVSLMRGTTGLDAEQLVGLLNDPTMITSELERIEQELEISIDAQHSHLFQAFKDQTTSLASYQVNRRMLLDNGMENAHNIVKQRMYAFQDQVKLDNEAELIQLVDKMATLKALQIMPRGDIDLALEVINNEMLSEDNGFEMLLGMHQAFQELSLDRLFEGNPTQMIKGWTHEMTDPNISIKAVPNTEYHRKQMEDANFQEIGELERDPRDPNQQPMILYKGLRGMARYSKSVMSLTDIDHLGTDMFSSLESANTSQHERGKQSSIQARANLAKMRTHNYVEARKQPAPKAGVYAVPLLNERGEITSYRYVMSESNKQSILKKRDYYDETLPRMFASIEDRRNTKMINREAVKMLKDEWDAYGPNHPQHKFLEISMHSTNAKAREMYRLMPSDTQKAFREEFGSDTFYIRDDAVNLILGFRKITMADGKFLGKGAPIMYAIEKIWQNVMTLFRLKLILQPKVVIGNMVSNIMILVAEGVPADYIMKMTLEGIRAMRNYQLDIKKREELHREIGSKTALGKDTRKMEAALAKLDADIKYNPAGPLVRAGLFTGIVDELGTSNNSYRQDLLDKGKDVLQGWVPNAIMGAGKEAYMLPGSRTFQAAIAATQYGDFVGRYVKFNYDTKVRGMDKQTAVFEALSAFIDYDIPQNEWLQYANDMGFLMFTKFFSRIQHVITRVYARHPVSAFGSLAVQKAFLPAPYNDNIANYALGRGASHKFEMLPWENLEKSNLAEPGVWTWITDIFGVS